VAGIWDYKTWQLPQALQNLPILMLANSPAWRNKYLMMSVLTIKNHHQQVKKRILKLCSASKMKVVITIISSYTAPSKDFDHFLLILDLTLKSIQPNNRVLNTWQYGVDYLTDNDQKNNHTTCHIQCICLQQFKII
jgi:hypothetical protein